ncbi:hypothetical protein ACOMHN_007685 [Nucella lapillus]
MSQYLTRTYLLNTTRLINTSPQLPPQHHQVSQYLTAANSSTPPGESIPHFTYLLSTTSRAHMGYSQHFGQQVTQCLDPYWSVGAAILASRRSAGSISVALTRQLCLQFKMALACLHTELTKCPTLSNIHFVQSKLGSYWAVEIRNLCVGQSNPSTNKVRREDLSRSEQVANPSNELLQDYIDDDHTGDDDSDVADDDKDKEIVVLVPGDEEELDDDDVKKRVKLRSRHHHHHQHHHRVHGQPVDIKVYNGFQHRQQYLPANAAASSTAKGYALTFLTVFMAVTCCWS